MGKTNINWVQMSDSSIIAQIGRFIKHTRTQRNKTQAQLAEMAGLNRWTLSQIENGESISLSSLIQVLRALDCLYVLDNFEFSEEISPLEYAKLKRKPKQRVRNKNNKTDHKDDIGW
jgi:transcriptional regulator with XRE-family HTH domain